MFTKIIVKFTKKILRTKCFVLNVPNDCYRVPTQRRYVNGVLCSPLENFEYAGEFLTIIEHCKGHRFFHGKSR